MNAFGGRNGVLLLFVGEGFGQLDTDDGPDSAQWDASFMAATWRVGRFVAQGLREHVYKAVFTVFVIARDSSHVKWIVFET